MNVFNHFTGVEIILSGCSIYQHQWNKLMERMIHTALNAVRFKLSCVKLVEAKGERAMIDFNFKEYVVPHKQTRA